MKFSPYIVHLLEQTNENMKRSIVLVVLLTLCSAFGLAQTIRNSNQSAIAKIDAYGTIRNSNNGSVRKAGWNV